MSISAMTNVAFARRADVPPLDRAPQTVNEIEQATAGAPESRSVATTAISAVTTYIPTEIITLYVAVVAALQDEPPVGNLPPVRAMLNAQWIAFWFFLVATPIFVWLLYAAKVRTAGKPLPLSPHTWPAWEMIAAVISFIAWAFALPNSPLSHSSWFWYSQGIAGVVILIVSTVLGLIAPIVQRPLPA